MENWIVLISIIFPVISSLLFLVIKNKNLRNVVVVISSIIIIINGFLFIYFFGEKTVNLQQMVGFELNEIVTYLDLALMLYILFLGVKYKRILISVLAIIQLIAFSFLEIRYADILKKTEAIFHVDGLSIIMVMIVSIIGSLIAIYSIGYMGHHEKHLKLEKSRQSRFFFIIFVFLGAMNGLVLADNLLWLSLFWEVTTISSFLLISHDKTEKSIKNAQRALWMNLIGGIAFILGAIFLVRITGVTSISKILQLCEAFSDYKEIVSIPVVLLCFAGFTKSAQFPFHKWLLGAMVGPTPVSALLHSSTMVKAGVYLIVRLSPAIAGTNVGFIVALSGGFTFMAASALAISQSNAKKMLAYSTIANLGLIIACAGIGSAVAVGAAILLIIFHAISKAVLFLCVGTIEQGIGSKEIEDMEGIIDKMPFTAIVSAVSAASMLLPPFGVLVSKWLAIEAAVRMPAVLILIVLGSAFTAVFWVKFIGKLLSSNQSKKKRIEYLYKSVFSTISILVTGVILTSIFIVPLFNFFVSPFFSKTNAFRILGSYGLLEVTEGRVIGGFAYLPVFVVITAVAFAIPFIMKHTSPEKIRQPYMCGENCELEGNISFRADADTGNEAIFNNYYLRADFSEETLQFWLIGIGVIMMVVMIASASWRLI